MLSDNDVERFIIAQDDVWDDVIKELTNGLKETHWMWFVFPQVKGISLSQKSLYYGIGSVDEVVEYFNNDILKERLIQTLNILLELEETDISEIFYDPDDLKFASCMTMFEHVFPKEDIFEKLIEKFDLERDDFTIEFLDSH